MSGVLMENERRASERWTTLRPLRWRRRGTRGSHEGVVIERSLHGLVVEVKDVEAPEIGAYIKPESGEMATRHGFRVGIVVRQGEEREGKRVVYVEILG